MSSNDLTQIRDYLKTRMTAVDSTLVEWTGSLEDIGNIPKTILDKSYHITIGAGTSTSKIDRHIEDDFSTIITTFKRAFNDPVGARDTAIQKANCIRLDMVSPLNIEAYKSANDGNIEDVVSIGITPSEIDLTNDNIIKVETELNIRLFFGIT